MAVPHRRSASLPVGPRDFRVSGRRLLGAAGKTWSAQAVCEQLEQRTMLTTASVFDIAVPAFPGQFTASEHTGMVDVAVSNRGERTFVYVGDADPGPGIVETVYMRRFDAAGQPLGAQVALGAGIRPAIAQEPDAQGRIAVAWKESGTVQLRYMTQDGGLIWQQAFTGGQDSAVFPAVSVNRQGDVALAYHTQELEEWYYAVFLPGGGFHFAHTGYNSLRVIGLSPDGMAWTDSPYTTADKFGARFGVHVDDSRSVLAVRATRLETNRFRSDYGHSFPNYQRDAEAVLIRFNYNPIHGGNNLELGGVWRQHLHAVAPYNVPGSRLAFAESTANLMDLEILPTGEIAVQHLSVLTWRDTEPNQAFQRYHAFSLIANPDGSNFRINGSYQSPNEPVGAFNYDRYAATLGAYWVPPVSHFVWGSDQLQSFNRPAMSAGNAWGERGWAWGPTNWGAIAASIWQPRRAVAVDVVDSSGNPVANNAAFNEGSLFYFRISRTGMEGAPLRVWYHIDGSANTADHSANTRTSVLIPAGQSFVDIPVQLYDVNDPDDAEFENDTLRLNLDVDQLTPGQQGNPTGELRWISGVLSPRPGTYGFEPGFAVEPDRWQATVQIVDTDRRPVRITSQNATGGEGGDTVELSVTRGGDLSQPLTVNIDLSGTATPGWAEENLLFNGAIASPVVLASSPPLGFVPGSTIGRGWRVDGPENAWIIGRGTAGTSVWPAAGASGQYLYLGQWIVSTSVVQSVDLSPGSYRLSLDMASFVGDTPEARVTVDVLRDGVSVLPSGPVQFDEAGAVGEFRSKFFEFTTMQAGAYEVRLTSTAGRVAIIDNVQLLPTGRPDSPPLADYQLSALNGGKFLLDGRVLRVTIPAMETTVRVSALPIQDDDLPLAQRREGIEWIHAELLDSAGYTKATNPEWHQVRVGFFDDDIDTLQFKHEVGQTQEGSPTPARFTIDRSEISYIDASINADFVINPTGSTASPGDYVVEQVVRIDGTDTFVPLTPSASGVYRAILAAGEGSVTIAVRAVDDTIPERDERLYVQLVTSPEYFAHPTLNRLELVIREDLTDMPLISVEAPDPYAGEGVVGGAVEPVGGGGSGAFVLRRMGPGASERVTIMVALGGSASWGIDFATEIHDAGTPVLVVFEPGVTQITVNVRPVQDGMREATEVAMLRVLRGGVYHVQEGVSDLARVSILDASPTQGTRAIWEWSMPDRYGIDANGDGRWDIPNTAAYANPGAFQVRLDGAMSTSGAGALSYTWVVAEAESGSVVTTGTTSVFMPSLREADYLVTLTVTDGAGAVSQYTDLVSVDDILIVVAGDSSASGEGNPEISANNQTARYWNVDPFFGNMLTLGHWADDGLAATFNPSQLPPGSVEYEHAAAHRSSKAAGSLTARAIELNDPKSSVTFVFVAQSGAEITDGFLYRRTEGHDGRDGFARSQIDQIRDLIGPRQDGQTQIPARQMDALLISLGINDIGFSEVVKKYLFRYTFRNWWSFGLTGGESEKLSDITQFYNFHRDETGEAQGLSTLPDRFRRMNDALNSTLGPTMLPPKERIFLHEYPDGTGGSDGQPAAAMRDWNDNLAAATLQGLSEIWTVVRGRVRTDGTRFQISAEEAAHGRTHGLIPLNAAVRSAAQSYGWSLVSAPETFRTRGWGASDSWFRTMTDSRRMQGGNVLTSEGVLHPNERGHQEISNAQLTTFLGDPRPSISITGAVNGVLQVAEGGTATIAVADARIRRVGGLTYAWDMSFDGSRFVARPGLSGPTATFDASTMAYPSTGRVAVRATDQFGRSTLEVINLEITNGNSGRYVRDLSTVDVNTPFWLGLERRRESHDPARLWTINWGDGSQETVPADWNGRSHVYTTPGLRDYSVWLTDAGGTVQVEGGRVLVVTQDPFPTVSVSTQATAASERGGPIEVRIDRTGDLSRPLAVGLSFGSQTPPWPGITTLAENGSDFAGAGGLPLPTAVVFESGQSSVTIMVHPRPDADATEGSEGLFVALTPSSVYAVAGEPVRLALHDGASTLNGDIAGMVYHDFDGDLSQGADEPALAGWVVGLDLDADGVLAAAEPRATTGPDGRYRFGDLVPGGYGLLVETPTGWVVTGPSRVEATVVPLGQGGGSDFSVALEVVVAGRVFGDVNVDGLRDPGESGVAGAVVFVDLNANGRRESSEPAAISVADGTYQITSVPPGGRLVRVESENAAVGSLSDDGGARRIDVLAGQSLSGLDHGRRAVAPAVGALSLSRSTVASGGTVTLTALGVDPWSTRVVFFRESNGVPGLQSEPGQDAMVGSDEVAGDGWSVRQRLGLDPGAYSFYAVAFDDVASPGLPVESPSVSVVGDAEPARVGVRALTAAVREGGSLSAVFEVYRLGRNGSDLTVPLVVDSGAGLAQVGVDFGPPPSSVVIPAGQDAVRVFLPIVDDGAAEAAETLRLRAVAQPGSGGYGLIDGGASDVVIRDRTSTPDVVSVLGARATHVRGLSTIELALSEDVQATLRADHVSLLNLDTGAVIPGSELSLDADPTTGTVRIAAPAAGGGSGLLPAGRYRMTVIGAAITDPLGFGLDGDGDGVAGGNYTFEFNAAPLTRVWDGGGDDLDWHDPENWTGDGVPGTADHIAVPELARAVISSGRTVTPVASLLVEGEVRLASSLSVTGAVNATGRLVLSAEGTLNVVGEFRQAAGSSIRVEVASALVYASINVSGTMVVAGEIEVVAVNNYTPTRNDQIRFMSASSFSGNFSSTTLPQTPFGLAAAIRSDSTGVTFRVTSAADANRDGIVNIDDIFIYLNRWFSGDGDINGNGITNIDDIFVFLNLWFNG